MVLMLQVKTFIYFPNIFKIFFSLQTSQVSMEVLKGQEEYDNIITNPEDSTNAGANVFKYL